MNQIYKMLLSLCIGITPFTSTVQAMDNEYGKDSDKSWGRDWRETEKYEFDDKTEKSHKSFLRKVARHSMEVLNLKKNINKKNNFLYGECCIIKIPEDLILYIIDICFLKEHYHSNLKKICSISKYFMHMATSKVFYLKPEVFDDLRKYKNLLDLDLSMMTSFEGGRLFGDRSISTLTNLTRLNLHYNEKITDKSLCFLINLRYLDLRCNSKITDDSVSLLTNLEILDLRVNKIISDKAVRRLKNLKELFLGNNKCISERSLSLLTNLLVLDLMGNTKIDDQVLIKLTNIRSLNINNNAKIKYISLVCLTNLTELVLGKYSSISNDSLITLTKLTKISRL